MKQFHIYMNEMKAESPSIHIHYIVTGVQSLNKIILTIFAQKRALPCVTKIILTKTIWSRKLKFWILIFGQHTKKNLTISEDEVCGPSSHLTWNDPAVSGTDSETDCDSQIDSGNGNIHKLLFFTGHIICANV